MYDARGIAIVVIEDAKMKTKEISNLQLQKILFYIQKKFLIKYGEKCFENDIVAWKHGPVVREVYDLYKEFGGEPIPSARKIIFEIEAVRTTNGFKPNYKEINLEEEGFLEIHRETTLRESRKYYDMTPWELVEMAHEEKSWKETEQNEIISINKMKEI